MELYTLDSNFNKQAVIEKYSSAIWTERYSKPGDFEIVFSDAQYRAMGSPGENDFIGRKGTVEVGVIEKTIFRDNKVTCKGPLLGDMLRHRWYILRGTSDANSSGKTRTDTPERMMAFMLYYYVGPGLEDFYPSVDIADVLLEVMPNLKTGYNDTLGSGYIYPSVTENIVEHQISLPKNFRDIIVELFEPKGVGWRMYPIPDGTSNYELRWQAYRGVDRSIDQSAVTPIVFTQGNNTLKNAEEIHSIENLITACHTYAPKLRPANYGYDASYAVGYATSNVFGGSHTMFKRKTYIATFDDMTPEDYHWYTSASSNGIIKAREVLMQRAKDIIANNNFVRLIDGEVVISSEFKLGVNYDLGDIVTLQGTHGAYENARIIEYIHTHDATGHKEYPTVTVI
jgi:hypothetical protein